MAIDWRAFLLAATLCAGCASPPGGGGEFRIDSFEQGLLEWDGKQPRLSRRGNEYHYEVNGQCYVAGDPRPCMWYGFEVAFTSPQGSTALDCTSEFEQPATLANATTFHGRDIVKRDWKLRLEGRSGRLVHPMYSSGAPQATSRSRTRCHYQGREVLAYEIAVHPPLAR